MQNAMCMTMTLTLLAAGSLTPAQAREDKPLPPRPTVADVVKGAPASDWRALDPDNTLYLQTAAGRVVIELAPGFAPMHVANIKALAREHYFDGLAVIRSQDNYVVQWGDADEKNPKPVKTAKSALAAEFTIPVKNDKGFTRLAERDVYAAQVGHSNGFPVARDPKAGVAWMAHCYGVVGVGRDSDAGSGSGTSLYAVNGHAPRHLDRNITMVGRVVSGMPLLSTLPRGTGPLGFYEKPEQATPILAVSIAADVPEAERSKLEVMRTDSASFQAVINAQRNRGGPWTKYAPGHVELCNVTIPVREQK
ncbi:peptidylprolyl isomerase [Massilia sp. CF038]|uniref:peptidylprolyl isomerase n=1 Tax=Massilia sp. CF038 TaxID=1881045 RepID=UPI00091CD337|nr:peptidylprolyl isomerase [Massilia sp. CF038]SHG38040.1 peptidylprolyl isomerase [Massilia sp. CF038]